MEKQQGRLTVDLQQDEAIWAAIAVLQGAGIQVRVATMWGEPARPYVCLALVNAPVSEGELTRNAEKRGA